MDTEIWRDIDVCQWKYEVSSFGNIRHKKNKKNLWKNLSFWYVYQTLSNNGRPKRYRLHRLIANAFIPNPEVKPLVNHKNWIKTDNRVENLEWATARENTNHNHKELKYKHNNWAKKRVSQHDKEWNLIKIYESVAEAGRQLNIWHQQISNNLVMKQKYCHGFIFKYQEA